MSKTSLVLKTTDLRKAMRSLDTVESDVQKAVKPASRMLLPKPWARVSCQLAVTKEGARTIDRDGALKVIDYMEQTARRIRKELQLARAVKR